MPRIMNNSARMVSIPLVVTGKDANGNKTRTIVNRVVLPPLKLVRVNNEDWEAIKDCHLITRMIDSGELLEGAAARKASVTDEQLEKEIKKDAGDDGGEEDDTVE